MKIKKVLVIDNMKDVAIEEHAYFGYHFDKEEKGYFSTKLYFSKKDEANNDDIEKTVSFTHVTSLLPSIILLAVTFVLITAMASLFFTKALEFNTANFMLYFFLPLIIFMSLGSFFAIKRTIEVNKFITSPRKNLEDIKNRLKK